MPKPQHKVRTKVAAWSLLITQVFLLLVLLILPISWILGYSIVGQAIAWPIILLIAALLFLVQRPTNRALTQLDCDYIEQFDVTKKK